MTGQITRNVSLAEKEARHVTHRLASNSSYAGLIRKSYVCFAQCALERQMKGLQWTFIYPFLSSFVALSRPFSWNHQGESLFSGVLKNLSLAELIMLKNAKCLHMKLFSAHTRPPSLAPCRQGAAGYNSESGESFPRWNGAPPRGRGRTYKMCKKTRFGLSLSKLISFCIDVGVYTYEE